MSFLKVVPGRHNTDELSGWGQERDIYREEKQVQNIPGWQQEWHSLGVCSAQYMPPSTAALKGFSVQKRAWGSKLSWSSLNL